MSLASPYQEHYYVADGVTTSFSFGEYFTGLSQAYVKSIIYFDDGTNCVPTFTVDMTTGFITIVTLTKPDGTVLTVPPAGSIVRVFRDTPEQQNVTASQLQNYTAKQLERIFDSVVAMIQEVSYSDLHKTIRLTETQRDVSVEQLTEEKDQGMLYWDFESRTIKATDYGQDEVVKSETVDRLLYLQPEGKIYFIPKGSTTPISIGSVSLHNDLGGRNAPDCHPESAITGLREHLQELRDKDIEIEEDVQIALNRSQEAKDTADEAKEIAEYAQTIAEEAKDIAEDAKETAEGIDEKAQTALDNSEEAIDKVTQEITDRQDADDALQDQITDNKGAIEDHITDTSNPHNVTKAQVGLGNADNTSDLDKPISTATQSALDLKMPISTKYGASISLTIDSSTYVLTAQLKDQDNNNLGTAQTIDLPLESVVVSGSYDSDTKEVILVLENGSEIRFSVADLISGLQSEITAQNPLDADLVNDSTSAHKFVTATEKTNWNNHIANTNNPHQVTKAQVGLSNVDNTSDLNKPISTATQTALDLKADKSTTYTKTETDTLLSAKQDTISDLATIRSGAALGATAVQPGDNVSELVNDAGYLTQHQTLADLGITATASEINVLDGITATTTELNYTDGVTSNIQTQLNAKAADTDVVHKTGNETISGTKTFNETLQLKSNLSFRSYGSSDSGRLQFRAQPSDNVIRGTVAITDGYSTAGSGYNGFVAQMVARAGSTTADLFNTIRVSNKGIEYIQEANDGTITGQYIIVDNYGLIPSARLAASGLAGQVLTKTTTGQSWETLAAVATSGSYNDLSDKPTIGNATLTIQKNSTTIDTFTANATSNKTIDIAVPTKTSDITNDSDYQNGTQVATAISTHNTSTTAHSNQFNAITEKIPAEASSLNKLADKAFVNSSIATNTANFIGTFNSVAELEAYSGTVTNNDYAFVIVTDSAGNTAYDRYKYTTATTPASWVFEYELNNSSFTATQWAAINSGANTTNIGQITTNTTTISNHIGNTSNPHQVTKAQVGLGNVDNTSDLAKPISTATQTALNAKANTADLATVATSGSYNDLSDKPTIPTVNNATLTIQKNGTTVQTFTANQSTNATANISVPTKTSDITNDSGFITSSALAPYVLSADLATVATTGDYDDLSNKPTIPTVGNGTITITQGGISKGTFTTNQSSNTTIALDAGGGGIGNIDNLTITANADDEIQAVAVIDQNTGIAKTWTGTMAEYEAIVTKDPETEYIITDDIGGSATEFRKEVSERNIGEIVYSTVPVSDSGLHLADGEVLDGTGIYKDFYDYMVAKSTSAPEIFTTEASWQAEVAANGVCGKYVLDTGLISIRLPKLKNKLLSDNAVVGNGMALGLTDGTTNASPIFNTNTRLSVFTGSYGSSVGTTYAGSSPSTEKSVGITTDSTKSGIKVASAVDIYCYVVVANTAKVPVQVDIDNIATELNACYAHRVVEFQEPTSANNYTWYRKYADGWVEQGGKTTSATSTVTLQVEMADTNYHIQATPNGTGGTPYYASFGVRTSTTTVTIYGNTVGSWWQVSGMAA